MVAFHTCPRFWERVRERLMKKRMKSSMQIYIFPFEVHGCARNNRKIAVFSSIWNSCCNCSIIWVQKRNFYDKRFSIARQRPKRDVSPDYPQPKRTNDFANSSEEVKAELVVKHGSRVSVVLAWCGDWCACALTSEFSKVACIRRRRRKNRGWTLPHSNENARQT